MVWKCSMIQCMATRSMSGHQILDSSIRHLVLQELHGNLQDGIVVLVNLMNVPLQWALLSNWQQLLLKPIRTSSITDSSSSSMTTVAARSRSLLRKTECGLHLRCIISCKTTVSTICSSSKSPVAGWNAANYLNSAFRNMEYGPETITLER